MAWLSGHTTVCAYVYVCKSVFGQKSIIKHFRRCYYLPDSLLCCATFVTLGNGVSAQLLLWRRVAVREPKTRRRGKHGISIENIAQDYTKNINHLNSWRCLCFLVQDLFQKSDQKLHVYDFQTCFPELFSLFGTAVNVSFEQRCRIQFWISSARKREI